MTISLSLLLLVGEKRNVIDGIKGLLSLTNKVMTANLPRKYQGLLEGPVQFNNPGNIETGQGYAGETGETYAERFSVFDSPQMGIRAVARDITTKIGRHKGDLSKIISEYAPPSENDTNAYIDYVKKSVGKDKVTKADLPSIVKSVIEMENGIDSDLTKLYLSDDVFKEAIDLSKISLPSKFTLEDARKKLNE